MAQKTDTNMVNLTPVFEHVFGVSEITDPKHLQLVIDTLEEMGDKPLFEKATISELAERLQKKVQDSN